MKLLLDENLSRRLVPFLQEDYPGTSQVVLEGLEQATDREIWQYAKEQGFVLLTKDKDYRELSALLGAPPQVILLTMGNSEKARLLTVLTTRREQIRELLADSAVGCVEVE
jgi:predicted nuclease of predicted toxin-antitoxin system